MFGLGSVRLLGLRRGRRLGGFGLHLFVQQGVVRVGVAQHGGLFVLLDRSVTGLGLVSSARPHTLVPSVVATVTSPDDPDPATERVLHDPTAPSTAVLVTILSPRPARRKKSSLESVEPSTTSG